MAKTLASHLITAHSAWSSRFRSIFLVGLLWLLTSYGGVGWLIISLALACITYFLMGKGRAEIRVAFFTAIGAGMVLLTHARAFLSLMPVGQDLWLYGTEFVIVAVLTATLWTLEERAEGAFSLLIFLIAAAALTLGSGTLFAPWGILGVAFIMALAAESSKNLFHTVLFGFIGFISLVFGHILPFSPALGGVFTALTLSTVRDMAALEGKSLHTALLRDISIFTLGFVALLALTFM